MVYYEELVLLHGMYGSMEAELEVEGTIKRAELTVFLCLLKKAIGSIKVHVENKENCRWAMERRKDMHRSQIWWCGLVDQDLGRVASSGVKRNVGGSVTW